MRNRKPKTRLMGGMSDDQRVHLREKALQMAQEGLARRGPVHEGSPASQQAAAEKLNGEKRMARDRTAKSRVSLGGRDTSAFQLHQNQTGNERSGRTFRSYSAKGGVVHDYGDRRVFVRKSGDGTGNRTAPRSAPARNELQSLAAQRAKRGGRRSRRRYFGVGSG